MSTQNGQHVSADTLRPDDMNVVDETANGFSPVGGDFFIERLSSAQPTLTRPSSPTPTEANSSESDTDPQATSDSENSDKPVKSAGDKSKLSTGAVVGIAVSMSIVGAALLAVGIICARKCYHKRSAELYWNREVSRLQSSKDLSTPRA
ncbi:hypothetical protein J3B02_000223 [Coemansia erecta]|nr:hypothetical protein J3B02_000223 [Coemansia erecta]